MIFSKQRKASRAPVILVLALLVGILVAACQSTKIPTGAPTPPASPAQAEPKAPGVTIQAASSVTPSLAATQTSTLPPTRTATTLPSAPANAGSFTVRVSAGRVSVPVLLYHHVSDIGDTRYSLRVADFRAQMKYLHDNGYQTISITHLAETVRSGGRLPEKPVVLTFDDGYLDIYENVFPILQEYGFYGVVYIITSTLEEEKSYGYMQAAQLKELLTASWEVGSHSVTHTDLNKTKLGAGNEMRKSKEILEARLGAPVRSFSYPFGIANADLKALAQTSGYDSAVGLNIFVIHSPKSLYYLSRREVYRSRPITEFHSLLEPGEEETAALQSSTLTPPAP